MVTTKHYCDKCNADFYNLDEARIHEETLLNELPQGFVYFARMSRATHNHKEARIVLDVISVDKEHDITYQILRLNLDNGNWLLDEVRDKAVSASYIKEDIETGFSRYATPEEALEVISNKETVRNLRRRGLTCLVLDFNSDAVFLLSQKP